jgi:hypothetical protein
MPNLFQDIFAPQVLTNVISQRVEATSTLLRTFGLNPGGANELNFGHGRIGAYHIFNNTLKTAAGKLPGTAAGRMQMQIASRVPFEYPRMHSSIPLLAEQINNIGRIDDPVTRDKAGAKMIQLQTNYLAQLSANWRMAQFIGMMRDQLYYKIVGDAWYWTYTSGGSTGQLPTGIPAGNKLQLNMTGAGNIIGTSWATTASADIPTNLFDIHAAFQRLCGSGLAKVVTTSKIWSLVLKNDAVQEAHGTANQPYEIISKDSGNGPDGKPLQSFTAKLSFIPWVEWIITDEGLEIGEPGSEVWTPHVAANTAHFIGSDVTGNDIACYIGGEPIAEYDGGPKSEKFGFNAWSREISNPTSTELFTLDNALVLSQIPSNMAVGTVVF